jgi:DNA-binding MarR family transcriptional regulator
MSRQDDAAGRAWQLLVKFFFAQRDRLPSFGQEFELSPAQCHVLHLIEPDRPLPMGRLAETLGCDASNVTGLVDRLEARGLVRRTTDASDARRIHLALTEAGRRVAGPVPGTVESAVKRVLTSLDRRRLDATRSVLERLATELGQAR